MAAERFGGNAGPDSTASSEVRRGRFMQCELDRRLQWRETKAAAAPASERESAAGKKKREGEI